jgi:IPT/TIG domain
VTEWPGDLLGRADGPRPLPPGFRDRLEEALLSAERQGAGTGTPGGERANRIETALTDPSTDTPSDPHTDPLVGALGKVGGPRPLRPATNRTLERAFARRGGHRRLAVLSAAAALLVLGAGLTVAELSGSSRPSSGTNNQALAPPSSSSATNGAAASGAAPAAPGGAGSSASQSLGSDHAAAPPVPEATTAPAPVAISPSSGPTAGGTAVTITGRGLETAASVHFGSAPAQFRIVSATELRAVAPAHSAGVVSVTVSTTPGAGVASGIRFTYG